MWRFGTQYLGETVNELHIRMNLHKKGKTVCPTTTDHFNTFCKDKSENIEIIEILSGNGHDENGIVNKNICRLELDRILGWKH